ncbi:helix-turn-helix domain-containing protein [Sulfurovum riftiae]|uniref:helix-turn-helix domain-containing protein n=1 Tax=Sulfurovum riftiae TaxID=1630136 RepID=UPI000A6A009A|nr:helix-turn-helix transcriptional regulator [Sulfurovum riftiae]
MNPISQILYAYRKSNHLTQQDLVTELSQCANELKALNTVTLSRWETGTTTPSLHKKKLLLNFLASKGCFNGGECHDIAREQYEKLLEPLSTVFTRNYQYLIGNLPERRTGEHTLYDLKKFPQKEEHIEHIIDIEVATNSTGYYTLSAQDLQAWCEHPSSFCVVAERKKQHLGHFVMVKIKNSVAEEIAHYRRSEFSLSKEDFCNVDEQGTYYVHALYGRNPRIAALLNVAAYLHLFDHIKTVDNLMIFSSRTDGVLLTQDYGIAEVAHGVDEEYEFEWHGMLSPVEDILFSDTIVKLIF